MFYPGGEGKEKELWAIKGSGWEEETKEPKPGKISKAQCLFWPAKDSDGSPCGTEGLACTPWIDLGHSLSPPPWILSETKRRQINYLHSFKVKFKLIFLV